MAGSSVQGAFCRARVIDLCRLLDEPTPAEADPTGDAYCFERGASREGGGDGGVVGDEFGGVRVREFAAKKRALHCELQSLVRLTSWMD